MDRYFLLDIIAGPYLLSFDARESYPVQRAAIQIYWRQEKGVEREAVMQGSGKPSKVAKHLTKKHQRQNKIRQDLETNRRTNSNSVQRHAGIETIDEISQRWKHEFEKLDAVIWQMRQIRKVTSLPRKKQKQSAAEKKKWTIGFT